MQPADKLAWVAVVCFLAGLAFGVFYCVEAMEGAMCEGNDSCAEQVDAARKWKWPALAFFAVALLAWWRARTLGHD